MNQRLFGIDLTPLRQSAQYRRLYIAGFISMLGSMATYVAVPYQLKQLTHSTLAVGSIGLVELAPLVIFGLYGGVLADRLNRRRLIISMEQVLMLTTALLFVNALLAHPLTWILYLDAAIVAAASSLQSPSVSALNQLFVSHELQRSASVLANVSGTTASIIGPALRGARRGRLWPGFGVLCEPRDLHVLIDAALSVEGDAEAARVKRERHRIDARWPPLREKPP